MEKPKKKIKNISKNQKIFIILFLILIISVILVFSLYFNNINVRKWIDVNILKKEIKSENLPTIELTEDKNIKTCAFNRYIGTLNGNEFNIYDNIGKKLKSLEIEIVNPIFSSNGRFLVIAENKGSKLYVIEDKEIIWEKEIEGNISQVFVNKNGYVAITIVDTSNKAVIGLYDNKGENLFNAIQSSTRAEKVSISNDNKYLAIAEIDTSGTIIKSNIKVITIEEAKKESGVTPMKSYNNENGDLIVDIVYQDNNDLLCMYTNKINVIKSNGTEEQLTDLNNCIFASVDLSNSILTVKEKSSGLFNSVTTINIINTYNKNTIEYNTDSVSKELYTKGSVIALNLGNQVEFINENGLLLKRYNANQEVTNIVISDSIAGIIYRDRIEIVNL